MLNFKPVTLSDIKIIKSFLNYSASKLCDYSTGGIFIWRDFFKIEYDIKADVLFFKLNLKGKTAFTVPVSDNFDKITNAVDELSKYCTSNELSKIFCAVSEKNFEFFKDNYQIKWYDSKREWYDYLYKSSDIVSLAGRKYSGQRNHINKFKKLYPSYKFEVINSSHITNIKQFLTQFYSNYYNENSDKSSDFYITSVEEKEKIFEIFDSYCNYELYGLKGGIISVDNNIAALSVGETIKDTLYVNIEKADKNYVGIYPVIVNEFANCFVSDDILYINREDDMGNEGLRTSKMSYHPIQLLTKYTIQIM